MAIGNISLLLSVNSGKFNAGLNSAARRLQSFGSDIKSFGSSILSVGTKVAALGAGISAAFAGVRTVQGIKNAFTDLDRLAKSGDKLGLTTKALSQFQFAAEISGVSARTFEMALQRMTRRISEAAMGTGEAKDAIAELGLDARALAIGGPEVALRQVADALRSVGSQSDRVRLAFKLFDSEGVAVVNMLKGGSAGLNALARDADRVGASFSRLDTAKIELANDALKRMRTLLMADLRQAAVALAPFLKAVADRVVDMRISFGDAGKVMQNAMNSVIDGVSSALFLFDGLTSVISALQIKSLKLLDTWVRAREALADAGGAIRKGLKPGAVGLSFLLGDNTPDAVKNFVGGGGLARENLAKFAVELEGQIAEIEKSLTDKTLTNFGQRFDEFVRSVRSKTKKLTSEIVADSLRLRTVAPIPDIAPEIGDTSARPIARFTGAATRGSQAAFSAINQANAAQRDMATNIKDMTDQMRQLPAKLDRLDRTFRDGLDNLQIAEFA